MKRRHKPSPSLNVKRSNSCFYVDDITNGLENFKIPFVNERTFQGIPNSVMYTPHNILTSEILTEDFESIPLPCNCKELCDITCSCALGGSIAYKNNILSDDFMSVSKPIVECSDLCSCSYNCSNRVVQKGIQISLQIFMTECKGIGVRTVDFIPKLSFVCEYVGELIDKLEAEKRFKNRSDEEPNYIFILKEHTSEQSNICTIIDPTNVGNVGRYINHSCSPNLIPIPVRVNSMLPRICFFAKNNILPLEELTYNYGTDISTDENKCISDSNNAHGFKKCHCHSSQCSGVLPFDSKSLS